MTISLRSPVPVEGPSHGRPHMFERGDSSLTVNGDDDTMSKSLSDPLSTTASRRVSFDLAATTVEVAPLCEINEEEKAALFLSQADYARIKQELRDHIRSHTQQQGLSSSSCDEEHDENDDYDDDNNIHFSLRGLETRAAQEQRRHIQRLARNAVLNEQQLQMSQRQRIPEVTAMLYNVFAFPSQQQAYQKAEQDAMSVYGGGSDHHHNGQQKLWQKRPTELDEDLTLDRVVTQMARQHDDRASVEDWLLGRFQLGQDLADTRRHQHQQHPHHTKRQRFADDFLQSTSQHQVSME